MGNNARTGAFGWAKPCSGGGIEDGELWGCNVVIELLYEEVEPMISGHVMGYFFATTDFENSKRDGGIDLFIRLDRLFGGNLPMAVFLG